MKQSTELNLRQQINMYFDNALSPEDKKKLLKKIECNKTCSNIFSKEKIFRDFIKNNVKRSSVSPEVIESIKKRINIS